MKPVRNALAFPFYVLAFIFHLLCAGFTALAEKIAGDDEAGPSGRSETIALAVFCCAITSAVPAYVLTRPVSTVDATLLVPRTPIEGWRNVKTGFLPEQVAWAKPLIRLTACIFAQRAVRNALEPDVVGFDPCGDGGAIDVTMDDDYFETTVSGTAKVNGRARPFKVSLNHYPPSTSEWGFIATGIEVGAGETLMTCSR